MNPFIMKRAVLLLIEVVKMFTNYYIGTRCLTKELCRLQRTAAHSFQRPRSDPNYLRTFGD